MIDLKETIEQLVGQLSNQTKQLKTDLDVTVDFGSHNPSIRKSSVIGLKKMLWMTYVVTHQGSFRLRGISLSEAKQMLEQAGK